MKANHNNPQHALANPQHALAKIKSECNPDETASRPPCHLHLNPNRQRQFLVLRQVKTIGKP